MRPATHSNGESLTVERTFDAARVNAIVNAPEIRPFIGPGDALDLSEAVARPENHFLMGKHGGFALIWTSPRIYEVHTFILNSGRGEWAAKAARDGINAMRRHATHLWTKIPPDGPHIEAFAHKMGMRSAGMTIETFGKPYTIYEMAVL